tara:strand:- start:2184 stop:4115 length:1932 start_codon:yes stop_codon:yes gene_type:complete
MSFENSTIIQLRESDSIYKSQYNHATNKTIQAPENGDYECLINPTLIEENDVLQLKSCYLDTVSTSDGKIIIQDDETNFNMTFYHYILNYDLGSKEFNDLQNVNSLQPDGKHYFLCDTFSSTSNDRILNKIAIQTLYAGSNYVTFGNVHLTFSYTPAGQTTKEPRSQFVYYVEKLHHNPGGIFTFDDVTNIKFNPNFGFTLDPQFNNLKNLNDPNLPIDIDTSVTEQLNSGSNLVKNSTILPDAKAREPHQFNINFTIPAGSYDPSQLAKIISDKVSKLNLNDDLYTDENTAFNNPLLTTNTQFNSKYKPQIDNKVYYVAEDGNDFYQYTTGDFISGTSQFGLEFDEDLNKFKFSIINNPYYADGSSSSAGSIVVESYKNGQDATDPVQGNLPSNNYFIVNKNSGIVFNSLTPESVWSKKMGFDLSKLCLTPSNVTKKFMNNDDMGGFITLNMPTFENKIKDGSTVTGSYKGLDILINKTNLNQGGSSGDDPHGQKPLLAENIKALSNNQNIIVADSTLQQQAFKYGYYMIQVDIDGVQQKLLSGNYNNNKIQAIISRYYSNESYTSAYTEGSIPFTYKGLPRQISKFKVRILQPNGSLADDIGSDNTVILELIKNTPPKIQALPMPLQQAEFFKEEEKKDKK